MRRDPDLAQGVQRPPTHLASFIAQGAHETDVSFAPQLAFAASYSAWNFAPSAALMASLGQPAQTAQTSPEKTVVQSASTLQSFE